MLYFTIRGWVNNYSQNYYVAFLCWQSCLFSSIASFNTAVARNVSEQFWNFYISLPPLGRYETHFAFVLEQQLVAIFVWCSELNELRHSTVKQRSISIPANVYGWISNPNIFGRCRRSMNLSRVLQVRKMLAHMWQTIRATAISNERSANYSRFRL